MKLVVIGNTVEIPKEKGLEKRDEARELLGQKELKQLDGLPCYLYQIAKRPINDAKKAFLQQIAIGVYYWEFFDYTQVKTEIIAGNMMQYYMGSDGKHYGLALFTNEKEILRRMDIRR